MSIANDLLDIKAFIFSPENPFTWASGIKSPVYCDNRITLSYPEVRKNIVSGFCDLIKKHYPEVEVIAGVATAGIPHAALVAAALDLPLVYVRSSAKKHGKKNRIEGEFRDGAKIVVIEDLISTGGSALDAVNALGEASILGVSAIFTYGLSVASENFATAGVDFKTILDFDDLTKAAVSKGLLREDQVAGIIRWKEQL